MENKYLGNEVKTVERAYKYRIYPNKKQQELIQKTFGCVRFVYNYYLNKSWEVQNMPEGLQLSERGMNSENSIDIMTETMEILDEAINNLNEIY